MLKSQGSGAWPYTTLSLLKVKKSLIVIQLVQTLHTSANILHVRMYNTQLTFFQQRLIKFYHVKYIHVFCSLLMTDIADSDDLKFVFKYA